MNKNEVYIYTDGACSGNPGPGGWGAILEHDEASKELSGAEWETTNNRMELRAVIEALRALKRPCTVVLTTDSQYVRRGITEWLPEWKKRQWKNANRKPVANRDLWESLEKESQKHQIRWEWVRGHTDHPQNERCDELAREAIKNMTEQL